MNRTLLALLLLPGIARAADLSVSDPWSRATPGTGPGVAYLTIHGGDAPDRLLGATSPRAGAVALHTMAMQGTVMRMRQVDAIDIPANGTVTLAPGGLHMMLEPLTTPLKQGETVPLTLRFEKAGTRQVQLAVAPPGAAGPPHTH